MKKILFILMLTCAYTASAQIKTTGELRMGYPDYSSSTIPKEFTYNNVPLLTLYDDTEDRNLLVYDEDINLIKTINIRAEKSFDYTLQYKDQTREVKEVVEQLLESRDMGIGYEEWLQIQRNWDPTFDESKLFITKLAPGDSIISVDYTTNQYGNTNEQMYFGYSYFGPKYPMTYWIASNGNMTQFRSTYSIEYTDWVDSGTHTENYSETLRRLYLCNINLNYGVGRTNYYFEASQTLFNNDEEFEYIIPKFELSTEGMEGGGYTFVEDGTVYGQEPVILTRSEVISEKSKLALVGFQVVSANGSIIKSIDFDGSFSANTQYAFVITMGETTYLAFEGSQNNERCTVFYKIDRTSTSIERVKSAPAQMSLSPIIAAQGTPIMVSFSDENANGSAVNVYSSNGIRTATTNVPSGQRQAQLNLHGVPGVYYVTRTQQGHQRETQKIILK